MLNWLEKLGARQVAIDLPESSLPQVDISQLSAQTPEAQVGFSARLIENHGEPWFWSRVKIALECYRFVVSVRAGRQAEAAAA